MFVTLILSWVTYCFIFILFWFVYITFAISNWTNRLYIYLPVLCFTYWAIFAKSKHNSQLRLKYVFHSLFLEIFSPKSCATCIFFKELTVYSGPTYLGKIIEYPTWWIKKLEVFNGNEEKVFDIKGPCCVVTCGCNNLFVVISTFFSSNL